MDLQLPSSKEKLQENVFQCMNFEHLHLPAFKRVNLVGDWPSTVCAKTCPGTHSPYGNSVQKTCGRRHTTASWSMDSFVFSLYGFRGWLSSGCFQIPLSSLQLWPWAALEHSANLEASPGSACSPPLRFSTLRMQ